MRRPVCKDLQVNDHRPRWLTRSSTANVEPQMTQIYRPMIADRHGHAGQRTGPMDPFPHAVPILPGQSFEEDTNLVQHLAHNSSRSRTFKAGASCSPVQALDLSARTTPETVPAEGRLTSNGYPLTLDVMDTSGPSWFSRCRLSDSEPERAMSSLFPTGVRRKAQPNDISPAWDVVSIYHSSLPTAGEASNSEWRLSGVTLASISSRL